MAYIADRGRVLLESRLTGADSKINEVFRNTVIYFGSISLLTLSFGLYFGRYLVYLDNPL